MTFIMEFKNFEALGLLKWHYLAINNIAIEISHQAK